MNAPVEPPYAHLPDTEVEAKARQHLSQAGDVLKDADAAPDLIEDALRKGYRALDAIRALGFRLEPEG